MKTYEDKIYAHLTFLKLKCKFYTIQKLMSVYSTTTICVFLALTHRIISKANKFFIYFNLFII